MVRFLEWVLRLDDLGSVLATHAEIPFPPSPEPPPGSLLPSPDSQLCPLCRKPVRNACVSTGGFVFCYECLARSLQINAVCPLSGRPCEAKDVIRVFS